MNKAEAVYYLKERVGWIYGAVELATDEDSFKQRSNDPIAYAVRQLGGSVADITSVEGVTDSDLSFLADADIDKFLDVAEYRALLNALRAARRLVSVSLGARSASYSDIANGIESDIAARVEWLDNEYGIGTADSSGIEAGVIALSFVETFA